MRTPYKPYLIMSPRHGIVRDVRGSVLRFENEQAAQAVADDLSHGDEHYQVVLNKRFGDGTRILREVA